MKKMLPVFLVTAVLLAVVAVVPHTFAQNAATPGSSESMQIPPTAEGPGLLLPDSPFYFLDQLKQNIRLAFAITPSMKARVYSSVAGERVAELRFELAKNNISAAEIAVRGIRTNTENAAKAVNDAKLWGTDTTDLAREVNLSIKEHQAELDVLENESTGALKAEVTVAQAALFDAKSLVEESLPKEDIAGEIQYDLTRNVQRQANATLENATMLQKSLDLLQQMQSSASGKTTAKTKVTNTLEQNINQVEEALKNIENVKANLQILQQKTTPFPTPTPTPARH